MFWLAVPAACCPPNVSHLGYYLEHERPALRSLSPSPSLSRLLAPGISTDRQDSVLLLSLGMLSTGDDHFKQPPPRWLSEKCLPSAFKSVSYQESESQPCLVRPDETINISSITLGKFLPGRSHREHLAPRTCLSGQESRGGGT